MNHYTSIVKVTSAKFNANHIRASIATREIIEQKIKNIIASFVFKWLDSFQCKVNHIKNKLLGSFHYMTRTTKLYQVIIILTLVTTIYFSPIWLKFWKTFFLVCKVKSVIAFLSYLVHWLYMI